jgi:Flagellar basal body rod protein
LTVQDKDGKEAYTRNGSLQVSPLGVLQTSTGLNVLDTTGQPITLPMPLEKNSDHGRWHDQCPTAGR